MLGQRFCQAFFVTYQVPFQTVSMGVRPSVLVIKGEAMFVAICCSFMAGA